MLQEIVDTADLYSSLGCDPDLGELVDLFVEEMPGRIQYLLDLYDRCDWELLGHSAHQMKGAAGSYGFKQITPFAARLETAVRSREAEATIGQSLLDLVELCRRVRAGSPG